MGITTGHEEAWLRMMLDDEECLVKMGLPLNMNESQKEQFISEMMAAKGAQEASEAAARASSFNGNVGARVGHRDLVVGEKYMIDFPNGKEVEVKLDRIMSISCNGDYIFENLKGGDSLVGHSGGSIGPNEFPMPIELLATSTIYELS